MALHGEVVSGTTSGTEDLDLYTDTAGVVRAVRAFVTARETDGTRSDYRHFELIGTIFITFEANRLLTSTSLAAAGSGGSSGWTAAFVLNGSNQLTLRVNGQASTPLQWRALIERLDT